MHFGNLDTDNLRKPGNKKRQFKSLHNAKINFLRQKDRLIFSHFGHNIRIIQNMCA